jgi:hypothetical protein
MAEYHWAMLQKNKESKETPFNTMSEISSIMGYLLDRGRSSSSLLGIWIQRF